MNNELVISPSQYIFRRHDLLSAPVDISAPQISLGDRTDTLAPAKLKGNVPVTSS